MALISQAQFSRLHNWTRPYTRQLVREKKLTLVHGKVDLAAAEAELVRNGVGELHPNPRRAGGRVRHNSWDVSPYLRQKMITEHYRALLLRLRHERESGRRSIPRALAAILAGTQNALEVERVLADAIDAALEELANGGAF